MKSPLFSDPYLKPVVEQVLEALHVVSGETFEFVSSTSMGSSELIVERYGIRENGLPIVSVEINTTLIDAEVADLELICSWNKKYNPQMVKLIDRLHVPMLSLLMGVGLGLSPRVEQMPFMLIVHLGQERKRTAMPFQPAEAACDLLAA